MNYSELNSKERKQWRSGEIRKQYEKMSNIRENGVKKLTDTYIYTTIAMRWCLGVKTVENIIFYRNGYD